MSSDRDESDQPSPSGDEDRPYWYHASIRANKTLAVHAAAMASQSKSNFTSSTPTLLPSANLLPTDHKPSSPSSPSQGPPNPNADRSAYIYQPLDALVFRLIHVAISDDDPAFVACFLMTYRRFATPRQVLLGMTLRLNELNNLSEDKLNRDNIAIFAKLRLCALLEHWTQTYPHDFLSSRSASALQALIRIIIATPGLWRYASDLKPFADRVSAVNGFEEDWDKEWAKPEDNTDDDSDPELDLEADVTYVGDTTLLSADSTLVEEEEENVVAHTTNDQTPTKPTFSFSSASPQKFPVDTPQPLSIQPHQNPRKLSTSTQSSSDTGAPPSPTPPRKLPSAPPVASPAMTLRSTSMMEGFSSFSQASSSNSVSSRKLSASSVPTPPSLSSPILTARKLSAPAYPSSFSHPQPPPNSYPIPNAQPHPYPQSQHQIMRQLSDSVSRVSSTSALDIAKQITKMQKEMFLEITPRDWIRHVMIKRKPKKRRKTGDSIKASDSGGSEDSDEENDGSETESELGFLSGMNLGNGFGSVRSIGSTSRSKTKGGVRTVKLPDPIRPFSKFYNQLVKWVTSVILSPDSTRSRVRIVTKFAEIATHLRQFHNYSGVRAVTVGIMNSTYEGDKLLNVFMESHRDSWNQLQRYEKLFASAKGHSTYRMAVSGVGGAVIPEIEIHTSDLARLHSINSDYSRTDSTKVHWGKFASMGRIVAQLISCQERCKKSDKLNFEENELLRRMIVNCRTMTPEMIESRMAPLDPEQTLIHAPPMLSSLSSGGDTLSQYSLSATSTIVPSASQGHGLKQMITKALR